MNYLDHRESAVDAIALGMGAKIKNEHPLARSLDDVLPSFAAAAGLQAAPQRNYEPTNAVLGRGMSTSDFSKVLADGAQILVDQIFAGAATHRAFCAVEHVKDFRAADVASIDIETSLGEVSEQHEIGFAGPVEGVGSVAQLKTFAKILGFSRKVVINDNLAAIARVMRGLSNSAAAREAALVTEALEGNPVLADGEHVFSLERGNIVSPATPAAFGAGILALRKQKRAGGDFANLAARHLVVAADLELDAMCFVKDAWPNLQVSVLPGLPNGRWFVLADQVICPVVATLALRGSSRPVAIEQQTRDRDTNFDGVLVKARADLGAVILGRIGIIRGGL